MAKYAYPAILTPEDNGLYAVRFPDLENCYTSGDDLADAIIMAEDVLALTLYGYEKDKRPVPAPSDRTTLSANPGEIVSLVACDTLEYQKMYNKKSVKKTLSIPEWLNEAATDAGINFSQVLQEALIKKIALG